MINNNKRQQFEVYNIPKENFISYPQFLCTTVEPLRATDVLYTKEKTFIVSRDGLMVPTVEFHISQNIFNHFQKD